MPKTLLDATAGGALIFVLLITFLIDRLLRGGPEPVGPNTLEVNVIGGSHSGPAKKLRLAVVPTHRQIDPRTKQVIAWDDMGKLLRELGEGYRNFDEISADNIRSDPRRLDDYDVLFLTCAPGGKELKDALVAFVSRGGTLYASDWRYDAVANAFPEFVDRNTVGSGCAQELKADVVDPSLREVLGDDKLHLRFELSGWKTAAFAGPRVTTLLRGDFRKERFPNDRVGAPASAPLLVKFTADKGTVIFTSFHNEKQNSETEKKLLQYLVFSLVTAEVTSEVGAQISEGGFAPQRSNLLSTPKENPSVTKTFTAKQTGPLRFALGFRNEGAKLRLHIRSPDGKQYTWTGESTVVLEVPRAVAGEWTYTVTALSLPYENFPFTVTVGEKK